MLNITQVRMALEEIPNDAVEAIKLSEVKLEDGKTSISLDIVLKAPIIDNNVHVNIDSNKIAGNDIASIRKELLGDD